MGQLRRQLDQERHANHRMAIGAGVAALGAWKVFDFLGRAEPVEYSGVEISIGAGLYLVIVAGVALIVNPYLIHKK